MIIRITVAINFVFVKADTLNCCRLLASASQDLWNYWIARETLLFRNRLNHILPRQLHRLCRSIIRQLRPLASNEKLINRTLTDICTFFLNPTVFKHLTSKKHTEDCRLFQAKGKSVTDELYSTFNDLKLIPDLLICLSEVRTSTGFNKRKETGFKRGIRYCILLAMERNTPILIFHLHNKGICTYEAQSAAKHKSRYQTRLFISESPR